MDEVEALKRDKTVLMLELVRLRQQQQVHPISSPYHLFSWPLTMTCGHA